jgi:O-methyltransferase/aklanonic acid methyltransferase
VRVTSGLLGPDDDAASVAKAGLVRLYDEIAATYGTALDFFDVFGRDLVAATRLEWGDRVLDVACGRGACLRPALQAVGETGFVLGIDLSPEMVALLTQELQDDRVTNAEVRVGDAERIDVAQGSFDEVICGFGVHHFLDRTRTLAACRRVLRRGGRFGASTFSDGTLDYPWIADVLDEIGIVPGMRGGMLTAPALVESLVEVGYDSILTTTRRHRFVFADLDAYMMWVRTQGLGVIINRLGPTELQRFEDACAERIKTNRVVDGYELIKSVDLTVAVRL